MRKETLVADQIQLKETALFLESTVAPLPGIMVRRLGITRRGNASKQKFSLRSHAAAAVPTQAAAYES